MTTSGMRTSGTIIFNNRRHCTEMLAYRFAAELKDIENICEANNITIAFDLTDGTLEIQTPHSGWKLAPEAYNMLHLYHKNTEGYDNGSSPFEGYHDQKVSYRSILDNLKYIIRHDWYKMQQRYKIVKRQKIERETRHYSELRTSRRLTHIVRMRRDAIRYNIKDAMKYAAGY